MSCHFIHLLHLPIVRYLPPQAAVGRGLEGHHGMGSCNIIWHDVTWSIWSSTKHFQVVSRAGSLNVDFFFSRLIDIGLITTPWPLHSAFIPSISQLQPIILRVQLSVFRVQLSVLQVAEYTPSLTEYTLSSTECTLNSTECILRSTECKINLGYTLNSWVSLWVYLKYHLHSKFLWSGGARG
jgi:hypothetical protein